MLPPWHPSKTPYTNFHEFILMRRPQSPSKTYRPPRLLDILVPCLLVHLLILRYVIRRSRQCAHLLLY